MDGNGAGTGGLLTIGAFARACRLSPKALRLYDDLGLLTPARVDPYNGYRRYAPAQLERAHLVAWLRRLGMPLARIREVCELAPGPAAEAVAAYWAKAEADTAARRDLAAFLVDQLKRKDDTVMTASGTPVPRVPAPLTMRCAAGTDRGLIRPANQDAAYAGPRLLAVADGYGQLGGPAAAAAIEEFKPLEDAGPASGDLLAVLEEAARRANRAAPTADAATGCTLTALLRSGSRLGLLHVGDSRAYVLRDSGLFRITHDHSVVQSLIDEGRLTPEEAPAHPDRALLLRALDGGPEFTPDLQLLEARPGERYLLCTDGLSGVVAPEAIRDTLTAATDPEDAVRSLLALAHDAGAPDNVGCAVGEMEVARAA
ncbi:MerR family transcriptional regulator [Streptomyces sp. NPDC101150]|uniref:MerR family transcriptional regulator n=1 Tax=Streptomyces sp. NPDC101150 TaxID=3366114 RepID=UPI0038006197